MSKRVLVCKAEQLRQGEIIAVKLGSNEYGIPREGLVVVDESGTPHCYLNECKHLPIPLDGGSRDFFDAGGRHLFCGTHGAVYRLEDGYCLEGPCEGEALEAIPLSIEDGVVFVTDSYGDAGED